MTEKYKCKKRYDKLTNLFFCLDLFIFLKNPFFSKYEVFDESLIFQTINRFFFVMYHYTLRKTTSELFSNILVPSSQYKFSNILLRYFSTFNKTVGLANLVANV